MVCDQRWIELKLVRIHTAERIFNMGKKGAVPAAPAEPAAETFDMVFHVQLAHGSPTKQVR
jgi:hypothetical protein